MSRILRRPMFRGGRVDARGTGITSNLGYKKGGSVNTPKRGLVNEPGGYAGDAPGFFKSPAYKSGRWLMDYLGKPVANVVNQWGVNPIAGLFGYPELMEQMETPYDYADAKLWNYFGGGEHPIYNPDADWRTDDTIANKIWADRYKDQDRLPVTGIKGPPAGGDPDMWAKKPKTEGGGLKQELSDMEAMFARLNKKKTKEEKKAELLADREMFEEAYGSGVADDASTMLLNFAGKALKPEATVKSAFGEFFEEEGKRPSSRKAYKDAATTAAINSYLTGEKSFNETMKALELFKAQQTIKSTHAEQKLLNASFAELKQGQPANLKESQRVKGTAELYTQYQNKLLGETGTFNMIESKDNTPEELFIEKYVGDYFMDKGTKEVFKIVILEDGTIGKKPIHQG